MIFGGVLEIIVALAGIGTAVVLYPVVKRQNEAAALGFVGVRVLEASTIFLCVVSLLSVVTLRQAGVGADGLLASQALVAFHDWIFLLGQGFLPAVNALLLGSLLYQSRLVPRVCENSETNSMAKMTGAEISASTPQLSSAKWSGTCQSAHSSATYKVSFIG